MLDLLFAQCNDEKGTVSRGRGGKGQREEWESRTEEGGRASESGGGDVEGGEQAASRNYASLKLDQTRFLCKYTCQGSKCATGLQMEKNIPLSRHCRLHDFIGGNSWAPANLISSRLKSSPVAISDWKCAEWPSAAFKRCDRWSQMTRTEWMAWTTVIVTKLLKCTSYSTGNFWQ